MSHSTEIESAALAWEDGTLGEDEAHAQVAPNQDAEIDAALGLHPISIRLQKSLLDNLKALAQLNGIGYQPLIRQVLTRWVDSELKQMLAARVNEEAARAASASVGHPEQASTRKHRKAA
ncbi:hypothetical protein [Rubrivivax gelatinosus]|uniref:hypothetical protein n=1 Tax=Rubrivivax gelatinosus TaxID=28068 RepID=UPI0005C183F8|nr:hypothetical protein [Rubrivivax gelatinosus]MBG6078706.1 putative DNA binding CopG/RHH family protein [Rubrivivax gelatinosus]